MDPANVLWLALDEVRRATGDVTGVNHIFCLLTMRALSEWLPHSPSCQPYPFRIPKEAEWNQIRGFAWSDARIYYDAARSIENANPQLEGVLTSIDFGSPRLGTGEKRRTLLAQLTDLVSRLHFTEIPHEGDIITAVGDACDRFLERLADYQGAKSDRLWAPLTVTELMVELLGDLGGKSLCDPFCRVGSTLTAAVQRARQEASGHQSVTVHGQEWNHDSLALARMNLLLHGVTEARVEVGNVLREPALVERGRLIQYDRIVTQPPWNLRNWGHDVATWDRFGRFVPTPPKDNADYAFVQHCMATLAQEGTATVLFGRGVLFRHGVEQQIRRSLLENEHIDAVIGLPGKLLRTTSIPSVILVLRKGRPLARRGKVLFVEVEASAARDNRRAIPPTILKEIVERVEGYTSQPGFSEVVSLEEIRRNEWNLSIGLYVRHPHADQFPDPFEYEREIAAVEQARDEHARRMSVILARLGRIADDE